MNNDLYQWHSEQMVRHEMHEVDRAVEQARLLREAGLADPTGPGWLARTLKELSNLLKPRVQGLKKQQSIKPNVSQRKSPRSA